MGILAVQQVVEAHFPLLAIISRWAFTCATISGSKSSGSHQEDHRPEAAGGTTALSIRLTDAPGDIQHAFVTITEIQLVGEDGILVLRDEPYTADLLTLAGQTADLVTGFEVTSGTYEQLRFLISGACIAVENGSGGSDIYTTTDYDSGPCGGPATATLIAPSYAETGLKVEFSGDVLEIDGAQTILLVDFDVEQSFGQQAGQSGMWVMHPVVTGAEIETE
jgi:hypothetical protein